MTQRLIRKAFYIVLLVMIYIGTSSGCKPQDMYAESCDCIYPQQEQSPYIVSTQLEEK